MRTIKLTTNLTFAQEDGKVTITGETEEDFLVFCKQVEAAVTPVGTKVIRPASGAQVAIKGAPPPPPPVMVTFTSTTIPQKFASLQEALGTVYSMPRPDYEEYERQAEEIVEAHRSLVEAITKVAGCASIAFPIKHKGVEVGEAIMDLPRGQVWLSSDACAYEGYASHITYAHRIPGLSKLLGLEEG